MSVIHSVVLDRRTVLQFLGISAATAAINRPRPALSASAMKEKMYSDGHLALTTGFVFPDAPPDVLTAEFKTADPAAPLHLPCTVPLLRHDDRLILFDAGAGPAFMDSAGRLVASLKSAGVEADQITDIVFTHCHPDHLWGVTDEFNELTFPNARYHLARKEFDFWTGKDTLQSAPEHLKTFVAGAQTRLPRLAERAKFFENGAEPLPGIEAIESPGHTPGHCSYMLHIAGAPILLTGDVFSHPLTVRHPDWRWGTDQNSTVATQTRRRMIDRIATDRTRVAVYHMPPPGLGRIEKGSAGPTWLQET
ncbi:MAG: MBL fold metallo-hydrolase [Afipia sp.]|nr:MBL fold metallo-hydrolase [Afipia sp.]